MTDRDRFLDGCRSLGITISEQQLSLIDQYVQILLKWNKVHNLIGRSTEKNIYFRHILDCAQLVPYIKNSKNVLDVGSGAGLPAIILAILTDCQIYACEIIAKKASFLSAAKAQLKLNSNFTVLNQDVHLLKKNEFNFDTITARAYADLQHIFEGTAPLLTDGGKFVLLKGVQNDTEISLAHLKKDVTIKKYPSITSKESKIITIVPGST